jgi:thiopeptide-type bacteriocin biosynthesis protein
MTMLRDWPRDPAHARAYLASVIDLVEVREALYLASPTLCASIDAWRAAPTSPAGARIEHALVKYVARMMGRATPFGLFAGVSVGTLARETAILIAPRSEYRRRTRLDNDYLFALVDELARLPEVRAAVRFRPNSSLYRVAGRLRYAAATLSGRERTYRLVAVEPSEYLDTVLDRATAGASREELARLLVGNDITIDDAREYIDELIAAQLLAPEIGVHVTGVDPAEGLSRQLREAGLDRARATLDTARERLAALDAAGVGRPTHQYESIADGLAGLPATVERTRLFQVDMVKPARATLSARVAADVAYAAGQLARITQARDAFAAFKRAFVDRWEDRVVPLAEVLDEESGIGFETQDAPGTEGAPLLAGLRFPVASDDRAMAWTRCHAHLLRRLTDALAERAHAIVLDESDLAAMQAAKPAVLPDAFDAMIRVSEGTTLLESAGGPSGARLLGRFCHASPEIHALVRAHLAREEAARPDAVVAEIVHLHEGRIGNILCRPVLRSHEIVYLGISGAPSAAQIGIDDLVVAVRHDRVVLASRRLGKEILPRLTTAHNFRLRSLGIYRFLCALATQGHDPLAWSWGPLDTAPFLPRVTLRNVMLSRAVWNLDEHDLRPLTEAVRAAAKQPDRRAAVLDTVAALRRRRELPRRFAISDGDNELPIDLDNALLAAAFADELAGAQRARLIELFPSPDELVVRGPEGAFAHEIVLTFTRPSATEARAPAVAPMTSAPTSRRSLVPGTEWLYAKLYCGESTADHVLREVVAPVVRDAIANGDAHQWFFIRYRDPDPHLRLRIAGDPARLLGGIVPALHRALAPLAERGAVRKLVLDTYEREVERYGGARGIELVEQLFWRDSEAVLGIIELLEGDAGGDARWRLALRGIESLLDALGLSAEQRASVATNAKESLGREISADRNLWVSIGERFTKERADLERIFARRPADDAQHALEPGFALLAHRDRAVASITAQLRDLDAAGELTCSLTDMAWSLAHMHANRLLHASQRTQEVVLYDFLRRLHAARRARAAQ